MSIEAALTDAMGSIPDCIAAGYVDMETGMLLAAHSPDPDDASVLDSLAVAVANLFQSSGVNGFANLLKATGNAEAQETGFGEIAVFSGDRINILLRTRAYPDHVICYVCRNSANVGLALTKSHLSLGAVTAAV